MGRHQHPAASTDTASLALGPEDRSDMGGGLNQGERATSPANRGGWGPALARGWVGTARLVGDPVTGWGPVGHRPGAVCLGGNKGTRASPTMKTLPPISCPPP